MPFLVWVRAYNRFGAEELQQINLAHVIRAFPSPRNDQWNVAETLYSVQFTDGGFTIVPKSELDRLATETRRIVP